MPHTNSPLSDSAAAYPLPPASETADPPRLCPSPQAAHPLPCSIVRSRGGCVTSDLQKRRWFSNLRGPEPQKPRGSNFVLFSRARHNLEHDRDVARLILRFLDHQRFRRLRPFKFFAAAGQRHLGNRFAANPDPRPGERELWSSAPGCSHWTTWAANLIEKPTKLEK